VPLIKNEEKQPTNMVILYFFLFFSFYKRDRDRGPHKYLSRATCEVRSSLLEISCYTKSQLNITPLILMCCTPASVELIDPFFSKIFISGFSTICHRAKCHPTDCRYQDCSEYFIKTFLWLFIYKVGSFQQYGKLYFDML
jgi:hypothetical protein